MNLLAVAQAAIILDGLNKELGECLMKEKYPFLDTEEIDVKIWYNNLSSDEKSDVLSIAFDMGRFSANYLCDSISNFEDLKKSQQGHTKAVFERKNDIYRPFDLRYMKIK